MSKPQSPTHPRSTPQRDRKLGDDQPPAEDELGGGDICSVEEQPSTDDDKPLD